MRCKDMPQRLQAYVDGQLSLSEARVVQAHLDACAACREDLAMLRQVDDALAALPVLEEPADFTARVMAQVQAAEAEWPPVPLPAFRLRWEDSIVSFAFACAVMAALFAFSLLIPVDVSRVGPFLDRVWWTVLPALDRVWHTVQVEPVYAVWGLSSLCVAVAASASAVVLTRQWHRQSIGPWQTRS